MPAAAPATPVSVIMPVRDEEHHLAEAVRSVLAQDYPGEVELVLAVAPSADRTEQVAAALAAQDPRVRVVPNPQGHTPAGLNAAIEASRHEVVARMDGHGAMSPGYLARAVAVLEETGAANVGGVMLAEGRTPFEQAVAATLRSPLGIGGARFHVGGRPGPARSVYLGVFRRDWLRRVGGYDPAYQRAQDWELNYRIRQQGGTIWFDPSLWVSYRPRPTWRELARQQFRTGQWRRRLVRQHPASVNYRYLAPPALVLGLAGGLLGGLAWRPLWLLPAGYATAVTVGGLAAGAPHGATVALRTPLVMATTHLAWGAGFLLPTRAGRD